MKVITPAEAQRHRGRRKKEKGKVKSEKKLANLSTLRLCASVGATLKQNKPNERKTKMAKIKTTKQFKDGIDAAFETQKTRDEAKACYDFSRDEYKIAEEELCIYAAAHSEVFEGRDGVSGWGQTEAVEYTMTNGSTIERIDGGKLTDGEFLKSVPKKYLRVKFELNKAKIKSEGLDADDLAELGLVRVETMSMKLKPKAA